MDIGQQRKKTVMKKLIHYSTTLPLIVVCDTSLYGILDILSHKYPDISEGPIVKACRSLSPAEKKIFTNRGEKFSNNYHCRKITDAFMIVALHS